MKEQIAGWFAGRVPDGWFAGAPEVRVDHDEVLDTLVAAGVARSRSDALGWCVRLVGQHQQEWIGELRDALVHVREVAGRGPATS